MLRVRRALGAADAVTPPEGSLGLFRSQLVLSCLGDKGNEREADQKGDKIREEGCGMGQSPYSIVWETAEHKPP